MKLRDIQAYDALPELVASLNAMAVQAYGAFRQLPLDEMRAANRRTLDAGTYTRRGVSTPMPADAARFTDALIVAAQGFVAALAALEAETPPDPANGT